MRGHSRFLAVGIVSALLASAGGLLLGQDPPQKAEGVRIGMIQTLFRGTETSAMLALTRPFSELIYSQTGVRGEFSIVPDAADMARQIAKDELQLGIMHGVEYAWIKKDFPDVKPLILAINQTTKLKAFYIVRADSNIQSVADLKGKTLAFPARSMNHSYLYVHKSILDAGLAPAGFFGKCPAPANTDAALEAVVDGAVAAAVVDGVAFEVFQRRKPGRAEQLKAIKESNAFPAAAFLYKPGACDPEVLRKFYTGMASAHERVVGRQLLTLWRISHFGSIPEDYDQTLTDVLRDFPTPVLPAAFIADAGKTAGK